MRVLVTGAAGFIGSHVVAQLVEAGAEVLALVRPGSDLRRLAHRPPHARVEGDLAEPDRFAAQVRAWRPDVCLHLAWYVAPDVHAAPANLACIGHGTGLLQLLDQVGCRRAVLVGTYLEYAASAEPLGEDALLAPQNLYAACKHALHVAGAAYARSRGLSLAWARLFNTYGPAEYDGPLVSHIVSRLTAGEPCPLGSGDHVRDYLHVEDVARALVAIAAAPVEGAVNVASGQPISVGEIARRLGDLLGRSDLLRFGALPEAPHQVTRASADVTRLRGATNFQPRYDIPTGLAQTVAWWRATRSSAGRP
jgi:UDP-glucuronate decarboxylase